MSSVPAPQFLETADGRRIAYHKTEATHRGDKPGLAFLGGFRSDMTGTKATFLEAWAKERGRAFLRFDYTGHGASSGAFEELAIGDWAQDAIDALDALTEGPQVIVGSSMGGWISLLLAKRRPEKVAALVGVAAAPDFTEDLMWGGLSADKRNELERVGKIELPSEYDEPYVITRHLVENGREHLIMLEPLRIDAPVRLLQGTADTDVPQSVALRLLAHLQGDDIRLTLVKNADHRMSEPAELALLGRTLDALPI